jgi:hypothetical protein
MRCIGLAALAIVSLAVASAEEPIRLHPENPRYFLFRGHPTVLITSAEHYGAVLNADFDYVPYLDELRARGFNQTRTFSGVFPELAGSFSIPANTMQPAAGRYLCPWARSSTPGAFDGGNKFDLNQWDEAYFQRLKDFVAEAAKRGVVVEFVLFNTLYNDGFWNACPLNAKNNINGIGDVPRMEAWSLKHASLVAAQDAMIRKVVETLQGFDNLYYEGCNEPYERRLPLDWQDHVTETIAAAESSFAHKHLIAQNTGNGLMPITKPHPAVSIFNYHYASPPDGVGRHYDLKRPIGFDETGGRGQADLPYRSDAWSFLLAGGSVYSNLDYSFSVKSPEGQNRQFPYHSGGGPAIRQQLQILKEFMDGLDFIRMTPDTSFITGGIPSGAGVQALAEAGKAYAIYVHLNHKSSVRWSGKLKPKHSEATTLYLASNDGARLFVDGRLLIDNWGDYLGSDVVTEKSATIELAADKPGDLKVEYYDRGGNAACNLSWSGPSQKKEIIPKEHYVLADGIGPGLKGEYHEGTGFDTLRMTRTDAALNFNRPDGSLTLFPELLKEARVELVLDLPAGAYAAQWVNTKTGQVDKTENLKHAGGKTILISPVFAEDIALRVKRG